MLPPQPHGSLPSPQKRTLYGASCPFLRRMSDIGLEPGWFTYSHQSCISATVPLPRLPTTYGSAPSRCASSRYSSVPTPLSSVTPPQLLFTTLGRCARGPTPSRQW